MPPEGAAAVLSVGLWCWPRRPMPSPWAAWSGPCRVRSPLVQALASTVPPHALAERMFPVTNVETLLYGVASEGPPPEPCSSTAVSLESPGTGHGQRLLSYLAPAAGSPPRAPERRCDGRDAVVRVWAPPGV